MRTLTTTLLIFMTLISSFAQTKIISLWPSVPPGNKKVTAMEERTQSNSNTNILSKVTHPELWYFPSNKEGISPAIIICAGGAYSFEAYEHEGIQVAEWLTTQGYHAFVLKYRLPDETLFKNATYIPLVDVRQALLLVRKESNQLNIDPNRVGVMGFSAGGHLAASAATLFSKKIPYISSGKGVRPDFSILLYPVISMKENLTHLGSKQALLGETPEPKMEQLFSLEEQVTPNTPPTFILHTTDDQTVNVDNTNLYAEALTKNQVPVKKILLPRGGHGFGFNEKSPAFTWTHYLSNWLKTLPAQLK